MKRIKNCFIALRDGYVSAQVRRVRLPIFTPSPLCRKRIQFSGRVQKVGFRQEVEELARRLELTGFCRNLENGDVLTELQGPEHKITYLVRFMESLKRIKIEKKTVQDLPVDHAETLFCRK